MEFYVAVYASKTDKLKGYLEPERGDLIEISRKGYQHWTIYAGDGYVIHLVKDQHSDAGATVKKEKLEDVADNDEYRINNHLDDQYKPRPIEDILQEAENLVGREFPYNLLSSNCEHFVTLLRYGNPLSQQVQLFGMTSHTELYYLANAALVFRILAMATYRKK
uniref:LRAT domain-containing protein n=1 Tax=Sinocyclocheilus rhinocerous TaxID=307959 RepID=A0A673I951_9TELE